MAYGVSICVLVVDAHYSFLRTSTMILRCQDSSVQNSSIDKIFFGMQGQWQRHKSINCKDISSIQ